MGHTAVSATEASSVTLQIWQHGAKGNYCNFASFSRVSIQSPLENILKCKHLFISRVRIEIILVYGELTLINA